MDESSHAAGIFCRYVLCRIKIRHFTGNLASKLAGIEMRNFNDSRLACDDIRPGSRNTNPDWRNNTQPGNNNSTFRQNYAAILKKLKDRLLLMCQNVINGLLH